MNDPTVVGVPERTPSPLNDKPDGSEPVALHINGASSLKAENVKR
jgi:hypothetical protein